jgi:hypothetical protein
MIVLIILILLFIVTIVVTEGLPLLKDYTVTKKEPPKATKTVAVESFEEDKVLEAFKATTGLEFYKHQIEESKTFTAKNTLICILDDNADVFINGGEKKLKPNSIEEIGEETDVDVFVYDKSCTIYRSK